MQRVEAIEYDSYAAMYAGAKAARARLMGARAWEPPKPIVRMLPPPVNRWHHNFDLHVRVWRSFKDYAARTGEEPQDHEFVEKTIYIEDIVRATARHFGLTINEIKSKRRTHLIVRPRQIGMFLSKQLTPRSLPEIGRRWGGFDHTTIISALKRVERERPNCPVTESAIEAITASLQRGVNHGTTGWG
jgi:hypothetical protein